MACHFLSSVHRAAVITEAGARLFQGTLCVGRGGDGQVLLSVWSVLLSPPCYCFLPSTRPAPSPTSLLLTDTLIAVPPAVLISRAASVLTYNQWTARGGNSVRNKVGIAGRVSVFFFCLFFVSSLLKPQSHLAEPPLADRLRSCQSDRGDTCF